MKRSGFCVLIVFLLAITLVDAKPAMPRFEPEAPPQAPRPSRDLVGTYSLSQSSDPPRSGGAMMKIWGQYLLRRHRATYGQPHNRLGR